MVKKTVLGIFILFFTSLTNSCFIITEAFLFDSDVSERLLERNNRILLDNLPSFDTGGGDYSFIVLSDTHIKDGNLNGLEKLPELIKNNADIKFAVITGDITNMGGKNDYDRFLEAVNELALTGIPLYPVLGNHDIVDNGWEHWKNNIGATSYRINDDSNNATLFILDSANLYYGKEQLDWLEDEIKTANNDIFVFSHVPLFTAGHFQQIDMKERARIVSILHNKCDIMFAGHIHVRHSQKTENVKYNTIESYRDNKAYCIVSVRNSGEISYIWGRL